VRKVEDMYSVAREMGLPVTATSEAKGRLTMAIGSFEAEFSKSGLVAYRFGGEVRAVNAKSGVEVVVMSQGPQKIFFVA